MKQSLVIEEHSGSVVGEGGVLIQGYKDVDLKGRSRGNDGICEGEVFVPFVRQTGSCLFKER